MSLPAHNAQTLLEKIQSLPTDRIMEVEDFVDFLHAQRSRKTSVTDKVSLDFPTINVGQWPDNLSLRRENMYGDDGR